MTAYDIVAYTPMAARSALMPAKISINSAYKRGGAIEFATSCSIVATLSTVACALSCRTLARVFVAKPAISTSVRTTKYVDRSPSASVETMS